MKTISEAEANVQAGLEALRNVPLSPEITSALKFLLPDGLTPVVQFEEEGRKKRSSASANNWNPRTGEIRIYFDPISAVSEDKPDLNPLPSLTPAKIDAAQSIHPQTPPLKTQSLPSQTPHSDNAADTVSPQEIIECCQALAAAEKSNRQFIALKWFRDDFLATVDFPWAKSLQRRQRVLSHAIDLGRIDAKKIPNPRAPQFPTTTISLNRSMPTPGVPPRFQPVAIRGEAASTTLLRDRGSV
ncbi:MAG: hypothetical protein ABI286_12200 [Edaphobacter sp.]